MTSVASPVALDSFLTFGDFLRYLRRRERLTQLDLSIAVGYSEAQISRLEKNQRLPDLTALKALFLPALHLQKEPELEAHLLHLAQSARQQDTPVPGIAPYKGLLFFDQQDAGLFFGREALTAHLVERVQSLAGGPTPRLLAIIGASGSGKSSVLRAGLAVALQHTGLETHIFTPTAQPLAMIPNGIAGSEQKGVATSPSAVWLVDQFEEIFTLCHSEGSRSAFIDQLIAAASKAHGPTVVLALRADFYSHCAQFPTLRQALAAQQEYIGQMSTEELRRAVEEPARQGGWEFEPGLVDLILDDLGAVGTYHLEPGALPLLSHALLATWERRRGRTLTLDGYRASRGIRGAIAETAESVFTDQLNPEQQQMARDIFLRLTELGEGTEDTRRRAALTELARQPESASPVRMVLNVLAEARLVSINEDSAEVAHEALIREWQRLREWLNEDREGLRLHRHLTEATREWVGLGYDPGALYRGARLEQVIEWAAASPTALNEQERAFLDASRQAEEREEAEKEFVRQRELKAAQDLAHVQSRAAKQLRQRAYFLASAFVLAILLAGIALLFGDEARVSAVAAQDSARTAEQQRRIAVQERRIAVSHELAAYADSNLSIDPERSVLLAMQAIRTTYDPYHTVTKAAEESLHNALAELRIVMTLTGHHDAVWSIEYSPDGRRIGTASQDKTAKIWDAASGHELMTLSGHTGSVNGITFSPDGTHIATASDDNTAKIWDAATGKQVLNLTGHTGPVHRIVFSGDGARVATTSDDKTARIWDAATGKELMRLIHAVNIINLAFSADGSRLAVTRFDGQITVWDISAGTGQVDGVLTGHEVFTVQLNDPSIPIYGVKFSPDGTELAASAEGGGRILDARTGAVQYKLVAHTNQVRDIAYSADGKMLVTGGLDRMIKVWDATTSQELQSWPSGHGKAITGLRFTPDGKRVATGSADGTVRIWDILPRGELLSIPVGDSYGRIQYSADGTRIVGAIDGEGKVWDASTGQELVSLHCSSCPIKKVIMSPDGSRLVTIGGDKNARVWDAANSQQLLTLSGHSALLETVAYSPDGKWIATGSDDRTTRIWDANTGENLRTLTGLPDRVTALAFSPDGRTFVTANSDSGIFFDRSSGEPVLRLCVCKLSPANTEAITYGLSYSPDGKRIGTGSQGGVAELWDATTGAPLLALHGHHDTVLDIAFSPDSKRVVTGSKDGTAKIWDALTGEELLSLAAGPNGGVAGVEFNPDGTHVLTNGEGAIKVYALPIPELLQLASTRVTRTLTMEECQTFLHGDACPAAR